MKTFYSIFFFISGLIFTFGQEAQIILEKKKLQARRLSSSIKLDGKLDEEVWKTAPIANHFFGFEPDNGKIEPDTLKTEVKILYDDHALYIAATLYDSQPNKILKEITERDNFGTADFFGVFINGFNDGQQEYSFFVSAANGQADCVRTSQQGEDFSWDAIWLSEVKITEQGWQVEMKIPYAAIRFSKSEKQVWGINFFREVRRLRYKYTWNKVDNRIGAFTQQAGLLEGIENIETPTRLFLIPYASYYLNSLPNEKGQGTLKGGMDLKYGLTDAFTLDAVLIPDFGQTKFDNKILNLGPFEQVFNENRPFFTEGTDLFNKAGLFYSRRIGGVPSTYPDLDPNEEVQEFPSSVKLLNALKVSGRTKGGLGVGILNAVTEKTNVTVTNSLTNQSRSVTIEPMANYNVTVLDQRFNQNSSVAFVNTNVTRNGEFRDANVSALAFDLNTKKNTFNANGALKYSYVNEWGNQDAKKGFVSELYLAETSGNIRYSFGGNYISKAFDNNDLGVNFQTNYYSFSGNVSYRTLKPTQKLNSFRMNLNTYGQFNNDSNNLQEQSLNFNMSLTNKKNHAAGYSITARIFDVYDYYDPRVEGRYTIYPKYYNTSGWISTNYNNKFAFDINPWYGFAEQKGWWFSGVNISPRYRFNDRIMLIYNFNYGVDKNELGWIDRTATDIIYARRDKQTIENGLEGKYSINSRMNFKINFRHYWSFAENKSTYRLLENGKVEDFAYTTNKNSNLNLWNFDLSYSWWFAPGSQMSVLYRNNAADFNRTIDKNFSNNVKAIVNHEVLNHAFSISVRYFIDYNQAKHLVIKS
ncbi:MAG: DUF5916 domain-containing protein [Flavobacterium sp.]